MRSGRAWALKGNWVVLALAALAVSLPTLRAQDAITDFTDDFARADGPLDGSGWTVQSGDWAIVDGAAEGGPSSVEQHAYIGNPATSFPAGDLQFSVDLEFLTADGGPDVGRHAGILLCMNQPGPRSSSSGYLVWWIDRAADRGINLTRRDNGALTFLATGFGDPLEQPPSNIRVEVIGDTIQVYADDELVIDVVDDTYRGGYFGLWTYSNAQHVRFDDVSVTVAPEPVVACFEPSSSIGLVGEPVTFDASCSQAFDGAIASYEWDFGDGDTGSGEIVEHTYEFADNYFVQLSVATDQGEERTIEKVISVTDSILPFEDDFPVPGDPEGWTIFSGPWQVNDAGELSSENAGEEAHIWAGSPAGIIAGDVTIDFDIEFLNAPADGVGRHASVFFYAQDPISRWNTRAYSVWWIDRPSDFGMGLHEWTGGGLREIQVSKNTVPGLVDPPGHWTITVEGPRIRCYGDGLLILDVEDESVPRNGYFGFWTYTNGQHVVFDNVDVRSGVFPPTGGDIVACARATPQGAVPLGAPVLFDASCTAVPEGVEISAYRWDFGDGTSGEGEMVEHAYEVADNYIAVLTVEAVGGASDTAEINLAVVDSLELPYSENFDDLPPGPEVPGWTVDGGDWSITDDGALEVATSGAEAHIWLGDPPRLIAGDVTIEFSIEFLNHNPPNDGVGKHAGVFYYARDPILRWNNEAYDVWWIDRDVDFGLGIHEWAGGQVTFLTPGTFDLVAEPPERWRIEVDGPSIRVFGDDELVAEADDDTRRSGFFGFWAYANDQRVRFDDLCIVEGPFSGSPDCSEEPEEPSFVRANADGLGAINITDGIVILNYLFTGGGDPPCLDAADADDNGQINITDGVFIFNFLFTGGGDPQSPFPDCGSDPTGDNLGCLSPPANCL